MQPDELQQAWQAQAARSQVTVDPDLLRQQVQRNQRDFGATILRRDVLEVAVGVLLLPYWVYKGLTSSLPWTWWLTVPAILWVIGYFLVDRIRYPQTPSDPNAPLLQVVKNSLSQVEHQIWLLRNVFWWYLLPFTISILTFFAHNAWLSSNSWLEAFAIATPMFAFLVVLYGFLDYVNQRAIHTDLAPRRDELRALLAGFETDDVTHKPADTTHDGKSAWSGVVRRWLLVAAACPLLLGIVGLASGREPVDPYEASSQRSPFTAVHWRPFAMEVQVDGKWYPAAAKDEIPHAPITAVRSQSSVPEVQVDGEWYWLVSLDDLPAEEIVEFDQRTYKDKWQKRFEEDLVELLTRMEHPPGRTVKLVLQTPDSQQTHVLEDVPMTRKNRRAIREAAQSQQADHPDAQESATNDNAPSEQTSGSRRRWFLIAASILGVLILLAWARGFLRTSYAGEPKSNGPDGAALARQVAALRKEKNLVGLAAMVTVDGQLQAVAADGERKQGSGKPVDLTDRWHIGSITKSVTATMIARLVESGQLQWSETIGERFPDATIHDDYRPVTLRQLLTHTAGTPANFSYDVLLQEPALGEECTRARRDAVLKVIADEPAYPPGEQHAYSNVGYTIAGAMAEQATGISWEDLVRREVFEPLNLTGSGFGPPQSPDETLDQPRGHRPLLAWKIAVDDKADNTPIMGPAGTVHMTLEDLCTYATEHLRGELGDGKLLSAETYKLLHTPELDNYACGWVAEAPKDTIPHKHVWHNGSNTMWYALLVFIPEQNMTVAVTSNDGNIGKAESAAWQIVESVAGRSAAEDDATPRADLSSEEFPKRSPFSAVRWQNFQPEVRVSEEWYKLVSLDEIKANDIVTFCRQQYGDKWQKRFEEDLVEVLVRMGHTPGETVDLVVCPAGTSATQILKGVPMTEANRRAIRNGAK